MASAAASSAVRAGTARLGYELLSNGTKGPKKCVHVHSHGCVSIEIGSSPRGTPERSIGGPRHSHRTHAHTSHNSPSLAALEINRTIVFLHGILGSLRNWKTPARKIIGLHPHYQVFPETSAQSKPIKPITPLLHPIMDPKAYPHLLRLPSTMTKHISTGAAGGPPGPRRERARRAPAHAPRLRGGRPGAAALPQPAV